jgi:hypothetical protein
MRYRSFVFVLLFVIVPLAAGQTAPVLQYATYLGGTLLEKVQAAAVDKSGNLWVAGSSSSTFDFPAVNVPYQDTIKGKSDIFVAGFQPDSNGGMKLVYWTWLGGSEDEEVAAIALDSSGRVYIAGSTNSDDMPLAGNSVPMGYGGGDQDAYIAIIDPSLSGTDSLVLGSYFGGSGLDHLTGMALDSSGLVAITGYTNSADDLFGVSGNVQQINRGGWDCFVALINPSVGDSLLYASYLGSESTDIATAVAIDASGNLWLTGYTASADFPTAGTPYQSELRSGANGFLVEFDLNKPGLDALVYGTYFGGSAWDSPEKIAIDSDGMIWVSGFTLSSDFPTTAGAFQTALRGVANLFVTKFDMSLPPDQVLAYSTYLGGNMTDVPYGMALLGAGKIALTGYTYSADFPVTDSALSKMQHGFFADAFVSVLDTTIPGAESLQYSTYYGGFYTDVGTGITSDANGDLYLCGYTNSRDLTVTNGSTRQSQPPLPTGFIAKIGP